MNTIEVRTKHGYMVSIKQYLTYNQSLELQEIYASQTSINLETQKIGDMSLSLVYKANRKALEFLIGKVIDPEGKELPSPVEAVYNMPSDDGNEVMDKIDEITKESTVSKKKGI